MSTVKVNPHRPYYTPGLQPHHNYTSLPSNDTNPLLLEDKHNAHLKSLTGRCTSFALLKYFLTTFTSPFEVGTTLLQVQYSPHRDVEVTAIQEAPILSHSPNHFDYEDDTEEEEEDSFFKQPERVSLDNIRIRTDPTVCVSVHDAKNRPIHQMAPMEGGGVLEILNSIIKQPTEGWRSLFKGQRVSWVYEMLRTILRPALENSLNDLFGLYDDTIPLIHLDNVTPKITTLVVSHVVIGLLLSPLEIVRTRLIVQSSSPLCSKYKGCFHALRTMIQEEGGIRGLYLSQNLLPTLFYHTITPLLSCSTPLIIARILHISPADSPILYGAAEFALSTAGLLLMLPIETIRKRLQCQVPVRTPDPFKSTVALRPIHYRGILDALYKIMKEEGQKNPDKIRQKKKNVKHNKRFSEMEDTSASDSEEDFLPIKKQKTTSAWGIRGLYRGMGMQLAANAMMLVFHTMNGLEDGLQ
ncbi:mitochondrial carrier domain-containing protein [Pilobolus umbonatus]|nr:mitochondrial carrier domain-containing protein [Pilobolus umbonatus]